MAEIAVYFLSPYTPYSGFIGISYGYIFLAGYLYKIMQTGDLGKFLKFEMFSPRQNGEALALKRTLLQ